MTWVIPCPFDGIADGFFGEIKFRKLCTHGVGALYANWREYDLAVSSLNLEVLHLAKLIGNALWQGELILGGQFRKHRDSLKQGILTLLAS